LDEGETTAMQKTMRWGKLLFVCVAALVVFLVARDKVNTTTSELAAQETALRVTLSELKDEALALERQIGQVGTKSYVESRAREDYQFIKEGELRFEFVNPEELYEYSDEEMRIRQEEMGEAW